MKFVNSNKHRLISLKVTPVLERTHVEGTIRVEDLITHDYRTRALSDSIYTRFTGLNQQAVLEASNRRRLADGIRSYYVYTAVESIAFIGLALLQVEMIRKLLGSNSIV
jgi:hypothetical protein